LSVSCHVLLFAPRFIAKSYPGGNSSGKGGFIEAFVGGLDLAAAGFVRVPPGEPDGQALHPLIC
jgi:hypothetical protein